MVAIYMIFAPMAAIILFVVPLQIRKFFREAGVPGGVPFIISSIVSTLFSLIFPIILFISTNWEDDIASSEEGWFTLVIAIVFLVVWIGNLIMILAARKYVEKKMPVFQPIQVVPPTSVGGIQGYSAPYNVPVYYQQVPPQYNGNWQQVSMQPPPSHFPEQNVYSQPPIVNGKQYQGQDLTTPKSN